MSLQIFGPWLGLSTVERTVGTPLYVLFLDGYKTNFLKDAVLEVPVEAVVDVPGEEGGVSELSVALGAGEPLPSLLPSSLLISPCTVHTAANQLIYYKKGSKQKI